MEAVRPRSPTGGWVGLPRELSSSWWCTESSSCNEFDRIEVDDGPEEVVVVAYVDRVGGPDCTADLSWHVVTVQLSSPLGDRSLSGCSAPEGGLQEPGVSRHDRDCVERVRQGMG